MNCIVNFSLTDINEREREIEREREREREREFSVLGGQFALAKATFLLIIAEFLPSKG